MLSRLMFHKGKPTLSSLKELMCSGHFNRSNPTLSGLNLTDPEYNGLLHFAAWIGNVDAAHLMLTKGVDVNERQKDIARSLLAPDKGPTPAFTATAARRRPVLELFLSFGADPDLPCTYFPGDHLLTPLHQAVLLRDTQSAQLLLKYKANLNQEYASGKSPLWLACNTRDWPMIALLLNEGALTDQSSTAIEMITSDPDLNILYRQWLSNNPSRTTPESPRRLMA